MSGLFLKVDFKVHCYFYGAVENGIKMLFYKYRNGMEREAAMGGAGGRDAGRRIVLGCGLFLLRV